MVSQMAREASIDRTPEYDEFIAKVNAYHKQRGTNFDSEPRVGGRHVDLLRLYNLVLEYGGYDVVCDEKLLWRKLAGEFNHGASNNMPALGFALKTCYYKYLAAYEISTFHGREPPPREILEDTTAKGGGLLTRTLENYKIARKDGNTQNNDASDASGDEGTPARDREKGEDTPGSASRATRGLRQAPPQRVLFQPDTQPSRQTRQANSQTAAQHQMQQREVHHPRGYSSYNNPSGSTENMSQTVANYEPRLQSTLSLRPVVTPGHNQNDYARLLKARKQQILDKANPDKIPTGLMLPGCELSSMPSCHR